MQRKRREEHRSRKTEAPAAVCQHPRQRRTRSSVASNAEAAQAYKQFSPSSLEPWQQHAGATSCLTLPLSEVLPAGMQGIATSESKVHHYGAIVDGRDRHYDICALGVLEQIREARVSEEETGEPKFKTPILNTHL